MTDIMSIVKNIRGDVGTVNSNTTVRQAFESHMVIPGEIYWDENEKCYVPIDSEAFDSDMIKMARMLNRDMMHYKRGMEDLLKELKRYGLRK